MSPRTFAVSLCVPALVVSTGLPVTAQEHEPSDAAVDRAVERLIQSDAAEREESDLDELWLLREHPLPLRTASPSDLAALPGVSLQDAINIVNIVREARPQSFRTLDSIGGIRREHMTLLRAFTTLGTRSAGTEVRARLRMAARLEQPRGARDTLRRVIVGIDPATGSRRTDTIDVGPSFLGAPHAMLIRCDLSHEDVEAGITFESDRHEPIVVTDTLRLAYGRLEEVDADSLAGTSATTRLNALLGGYLRYTTPAATFLGGDFTVGAGQGLVLGGPSGGPSLAAGFDQPLHPSPGYRPYRSTGESGFLRGLAVDATVYRTRRLTGSLSAFASWRDLDATVTMETDSNGAFVPSIGSVGSDGVRRTVSEIRRAGALLERLFGATVSVAGSGWSAGAVWTAGRRSIPSADSGLHWTVASLHYRTGDARRSLFAETATDGRQIALVAGMSQRAASTEFRATLSSMPVGFSSPYAAVHPQSDLSPGEHVLTLGVRTSTGPLTVAASVALTRRTAATATRPYPSWSAAGTLEGTYAPSRALTLHGRVRAREDIDALRTGDALGRTWRTAILQRSVGIRIGAEIEPDALPLHIRAHFERRLVEFETLRPPATGWTTYLACRVEPWTPLVATAIAALHTASDADAAPAIAFSDLPGHTLSLRLHGDGAILGLSARWVIADGISIAASFLRTRRIDRGSLRSGSDEILGPVEHSLSVQVDFRPSIAD